MLFLNFKLNIVYTWSDHPVYLMSRYMVFSEDFINDYYSMVTVAAEHGKKFQFSFFFFFAMK